MAPRDHNARTANLVTMAMPWSMTAKVNNRVIEPHIPYLFNTCNTMQVMTESMSPSDIETWHMGRNVSPIILIKCEIIVCFQTVLNNVIHFICVKS